jgi:anthranilate synthase component 2
MKVLVLDNYDSFTYNLVHILRKLGMHDTLDVVRNDRISLGKVGEYDKILLSPGPGIPDEAGIMKAVIDQYGSKKSILGVCLGHQGMGEVYGARLFNMPVVRHGVTTTVTVDPSKDYLFRNMENQFQVCLYHSWAIVPDSIVGMLEVTARDEYGTIMGIRHREWDVRGVQFHPESILTQNGEIIIKNWLSHGN